jgi:hypothetical protein
MLKVVLSSRSVPGSQFNINSFWPEPFHWVLLAVISAVLGFICPAFVFILQGCYGNLSHFLVTAGCVLAYGFLGCLTIGQLGRSGVLERKDRRALATLCVSGMTVFAIPVSVLFLCWNDTAVFLLVGAIPTIIEHY